jgi:hypothetical protein
MARVLATLVLVAGVPALAACAGQSKEVSSCVDRIAARGSGDDPRTVTAIAHEVEHLRRLSFRVMRKPTYVRQAEMKRRIRAELDRASGREIAVAQHALVALAAIPEGMNLKKVAGNELASDVAGYYDDRTRVLVVLSDSNHRTLNAFERVTLAHELDHALTDQRLGLPGDRDGAPPGGEDAETAQSALVEGDATLLMEAYARANFSPSDALDALGGASGGSGQLPHYIEASEVFPYLDGEKFVCRLYRRGGWNAVDEAYRRPPVSTAQILFPRRYIAHERPVAPPPAPSPGAGWKRFSHAAVGAADLLWLFEAPGDKPARALSQPRRRAAAWAGGMAVIWTRGPRTALELTLVERRGVRPRLCASMRAWAKAAGRPASGITCAGRIVRVSLRS